MEYTIKQRKVAEREMAKNREVKMNEKQCKECKEILKNLARMMTDLDTMRNAGINVDSLEGERRRLTEAFTLLDRYLGG